MDETLEVVLDTYVRPRLQAHGGDLEVLDIEDGILRFRFKGKCAGCPAADMTTEAVVQAAVKQYLPKILEAVLVHPVSEKLLKQAHSLLGQHHVK